MPETDHDPTIEAKRYDREMRMFRQVTFSVTGADESELWAAINRRLNEFAPDRDDYEVVQMSARSNDNPLDGGPWIADVLAVREAGLVPWA